jgi:hypothetical protein
MSSTVDQHIRGRRGFRAWLQTPDVKLESCHCGWVAELGPHFRVRLDASSSSTNSCQNGTLS